MYQRVLVTLDGSELAECSLEHARVIAKGCHVSEMVLLNVVEPLSADTMEALTEGGIELLDKAEKEQQQAPLAYLKKLSDQLKKEGIKCRSVVLNGGAAEEILDYSQKNKIDLIIMSTHGRSGLSRWLFGSIADKVTRHSTIPVLLVSPSGCRM